VTAIAVIIGRAGSKGLPGKNARPILGRPLVAYTIDAALDAETVTRTVLSTDGDAIAAAGAAAGIEVVRRPPELATDTATVASAVRHAVLAADAAAPVTEPVVVILYANVPVRPPDLIDGAVRMLLESGAHSVQSYAEVGKHHPYWMSKLDADGHVTPYIVNTIDRRQDLPPLYLPDGGVIAVMRSTMLGAPGNAPPHAFLGEDRRGLINRRDEVIAVVDVDHEIDLRVAEAMLRERQPASEAAR
jgi:CMP-N-acetylneuraminic acid synthetase